MHVIHLNFSHAVQIMQIVACSLFNMFSFSFREEEWNECCSIIPRGWEHGESAAKISDRMDDKQS